MQRVVIIASIGATAFIVFTMPKNSTARPIKIIGGHIIGLGSGALASIILNNIVFPHIIVYSLAVGLSMFLMVALDLEHPPASGTALGVAITGFSVDVLVMVITSSVVVALAHKYLSRFLKDLT
ncbi:HPP family protein [Chloroflexota bacterium]